MLGRKKNMSIIISGVLMLSSCFTSFGTLQASAAQVVKIDPNCQHQTLEGWGSNLAWWGNTIGDWPEEKSNEIGELLFGDTGLDMNIVRFNIGGGENPSHDHMNSGCFINAEMQGYQPENGVWDWNGDAGERNMMQIAKEKGVNIFEAFANSAPYWMTISGCAAGNLLSAPNFNTSYTDEFTNYLAEVVLHAKDNWDIDFRTVEAFNEPDGFWHKWRPQEGMIVLPSDQNNIVKSLQGKLDEKGLHTEITAMDVWSKDHLDAQYRKYDDTARSYVKQMNVHSYSGTDQLGTRAFAKTQGKRLWMSEYGCGSGHDHNDMNNGVTLASTVLDDMRNMQPEAWLYWQPVENEEEREDSYGFIHANYRDNSYEYWLTKQYYTFGQFSKFMKQGYKIIDSNNPNTLVAFDKSTKQLVIVILNKENNDVNYKFDLSMFNNGTSNVEVYRTSATENLQKLSDINVTNSVLNGVTIPNSVTTYVVNDIDFTPLGNLTEIDIDTVNASENHNISTTTGSCLVTKGFNNINRSNTYGDYTIINFYGTGIELYGDKNEESGIATVSIDDGAEIGIDLYSDANKADTYLYSSEKLFPGNHTLKVRVSGQKNPFSSGNNISLTRARSIDYQDKIINIINEDARGITDVKIGLDYYIDGTKHYDYENVGTLDGTIITSLQAAGGRNDGIHWIGDFLILKQKNSGEKKLSIANLEIRNVEDIRVHIDFKIDGKRHYDYEDVSDFNHITNLKLNAVGGTFNGIRWVGDFLKY